LVKSKFSTVGKQLIKKRRSDGIIQGYWVTIIDDDEIEGLYTVEWVLHWEYNDGSPSGLRQWEVRIRLPSDIDLESVTSYGENILNQYVDNELVTASNFSVNKAGVDPISGGVHNDIEYKIIDNARPQYNYPKGKWGRWRIK